MWRTNKKSDNIMRTRAHDHLSMVSDDDECLVSFFVLAAVTLTVIPRLLAQLLLGIYSGILLFSPTANCCFLINAEEVIRRTGSLVHSSYAMVVMTVPLNIIIYRLASDLV